MVNIVVGDVHGCYEQLRRLLDKAQFNMDNDTLWLTGDLVSRGPDSLKVLQFARSLSLNKRLRLTLGNHDLHLLAIHAGVSQDKKKDNLMEVLAAPDCDELMRWLRMQPVLQIDKQLKLVMVHAGISPQWDLKMTQQCAKELQSTLASDDYIFFLKKIYGNQSHYWSPTLQGPDRLRYITNVFTRMRYCYADGRLDFDCKTAPSNAPDKIKPWFSLPNQIPPEYSIIFGHWASLGGKAVPPRIYGLDTGCCWGGELTAFRFEDKQFFKKSCHKTNTA